MHAEPAARAFVADHHHVASTAGTIQNRTQGPFLGVGHAVCPAKVEPSLSIILAAAPSGASSQEFFQNAGNQPNTRNLVKYLGETWNEKINAKSRYDLFPGDPSKQDGRIAGPPSAAARAAI